MKTKSRFCKGRSFSMSEPLYRAINPTTYLILAAELASKDEIAAKRTAADRIYYATFLICRDYLAAKGYLTPYYSARDHQYISETLKNIKVLGSLGNDEIRLRDTRNRVTYDTRELSQSQPDVRNIDWMLRTARIIIQKVQELPVNSDKRFQTE
jgi:hypothetical protein